MRHQSKAPHPRASRPHTVFLDRDGVINRRIEGGYVTTWDEFEFLPGALEALRQLTRHGYRIVVVTNQRGIARGRLTETELAAIHDRMLERVGATGGAIAGVYYCPHDVGECSCRKPSPGLFLEAKADFVDIDFSDSTVIGDSPSDIDAGVSLGCATIFIGQGGAQRCAPTLDDAVVRFLIADPAPSGGLGRESC